ncbi:aldehyde dehydrogenase family protein [Nakamurella antarctica]|uniref:Aldehyde dehydrogenase family protein n=1 Tax=Nakamurella antarctica TaxID=1902245 RepID=A0A3G8ZYT2_9ACTN|nr:aldehyde dehydrogenase family protein [Nakamurella antarctica]AZI58731.1 aldehyde dehydrogenase family protein [Nakamurella antarctica]
MTDAFVPAYPAGLPIAGQWITDGVATVDVLFPYDGSVVAKAPVGNVEHAKLALDAGLRAQPVAARLSAAQRRDILLGVHAELAARRSEFEDLLVLETGKPLFDCRIEVERTLFTWLSTAEEISHQRGETVPLDLQPSGVGMIGYWTRKPVGLVVGIAGFNYPLLLATHKIAPCIAAGCAVIAKPAPNTPLATVWLVYLIQTVLQRLSLTVDLVQLVTGGVEVGHTLTSDPRIGAVSFTGSAAVGHQIAKDCAPRKVLLELGSSSALIVAADANLVKAADAVIRGGFYANGQACISIQRVLVEAAVADEFGALVLAGMPRVLLGDPRDIATRVAPLINAAATARVLDWVNEAVDAGAKVGGGGAVVNSGTAVAPTVLFDVPDGVRAWDEEIFGPVVAIRTVPDLDTAIAVANASRYGLQASIFTRSLATAFRAIEELEVGGVVVNEIPGFRSDIMPYGGVKDSGIGREGPRFAIEELTVTRMAIIRPE